MDSSFHFCRPNAGIIRKTLPNETTANVFNKVKDTVASAFRAPTPAMALA